MSFVTLLTSRPIGFLSKYDTSSETMWPYRSLRRSRIECCESRMSSFQSSFPSVMLMQRMYEARQRGFEGECSLEYVKIFPSLTHQMLSGMFVPYGLSNPGAVALYVHSSFPVCASKAAMVPA